MAESGKPAGSAMRFSVVGSSWAILIQDPPTYFPGAVPERLILSWFNLQLCKLLPARHPQARQTSTTWNNHRDEAQTVAGKIPRSESQPSPHLSSGVSGALADCYLRSPGLASAG